MKIYRGRLKEDIVIIPDHLLEEFSCKEKLECRVIDDKIIILD